MKTRTTTLTILVGLLPFMCSAQGDAEIRLPRHAERAGGKYMPGAGDGKQDFAKGREWMEQFRTDNPEEFQRLMKLRESDPEAFRREIMKNAGKLMQERRGEGVSEAEKRTHDLAAQYRAAATDAERQKIKTELTDAVKSAFDEQQQRRQEQLAKLEQYLERLRSALEERHAHRDKIVNERVEQITRDPALRWEPRLD